MRKREVKALKCKAYHEAGHAVMAAHLSTEIDEITIVRRFCMGQSDQPTIQLAEVDLSPDGRIRIERASMVAFAGPEAEAMHCSHTIWHPCSRGDREFPTDLARILCDSEQLSNEWLKSIKTRTQEILRTRERSVHEIALALMAKKRLTGDEVMDFVFPPGKSVVSIN